MEPGLVWSFYLCVAELVNIIRIATGLKNTEEFERTYINIIVFVTFQSLILALACYILNGVYSYYCKLKKAQAGHQILFNNETQQQV